MAERERGSSEVCQAPGTSPPVYIQYHPGSLADCQCLPCLYSSSVLHHLSSNHIKATTNKKRTRQTTTPSNNILIHHHVPLRYQRLGKAPSTHAKRLTSKTEQQATHTRPNSEASRLQPSASPKEKERTVTFDLHSLRRRVEDGEDEADKRRRGRGRQGQFISPVASPLFPLSKLITPSIPSHSTQPSTCPRLPLPFSPVATIPSFLYSRILAVTSWAPTYALPSAIPGPPPRQKTGRDKSGICHLLT
ncbi:uncharacterized protein BKA78DRAFT_158052 [Phyllosticta capitalensis]|uniref:uncharacterized protein n=1 Tax=Phyllosticta capitalensis TaxID=121624 RepID=UPI0031308067